MKKHNPPQFILREISKYDWKKLEELCGKKKTRLLNDFAIELKEVFGKRQIDIWTFNSAAAGGGVADLLDALTSLSREKDINWQWFVIGGSPQFFRATKIFHNALHGSSKIKVTDKILRDYLKGIMINVQILYDFLINRWKRANANRATRKFPSKSVEIRNVRRPKQVKDEAPEIVLVHDPQPLALFPEFKKQHPRLFREYFQDTVFIWQSHIPFKISSSSRLAKFLIKYINFYDLAIYHRNNPAPSLKIPVFNQNINSINPLSYINIDLEGLPGGREFIDVTIAKHGIRRYGPKTWFIVQNARFDPWKDPLGVIEAFQGAFEILKKEGKTIKLILTGPVAGDDIEEAGELLAQIKKVADRFNARQKGKFIYVKPLFTRRENLTAEQWEKFLSIGFNPDRLSPHLNRFQRRAAKKMGIDIRALNEYNMHDLEINAFQTFGHILILKSLEEGQGLAAMGAKFKRKPLIASAVGGLIHQIEDHQNGILVGLDPRNKRPVTDLKKLRKLTISQTKEAIVELVRNPKLAKKLGLAARRDALENYTTLRQLRDYYQIFIDAKRQKDKKDR